MAPIGGDNNVGPSSSHFPDQQPLTSSLTDVTVVSSAQRTREPGQHARPSEVHRRHSPCALACGRGRRRLSAWILPGVIRHVRPDIDHPGHRARRAVELPGREPDDRLHPATALSITNSALFHSLPTVLRSVGPWQTRGGSLNDFFWGIWCAARCVTCGFGSRAGVRHVWAVRPVGPDRLVRVGR